MNTLPESARIAMKNLAPRIVELLPDQHISQRAALPIERMPWKFPQDRSADLQVGLKTREAQNPSSNKHFTPPF